MMLLVNGIVFHNWPTLKQKATCKPRPFNVNDSHNSTRMYVVHLNGILTIIIPELRTDDYFH